MHGKEVRVHTLYMYMHFHSGSLRVDGGEEVAVLQREIAEEVEEEREQYLSELPEREALYHTQLAEWKAFRKMRVRERVERERVVRGEAVYYIQLRS